MSGSFVDIPTRTVHPGSHGQFIRQIIAEFVGMVDTYSYELSTAITTITAIINSVPPSLNITNPDDIDVPSPNFPDKPIFGGLDLKDYPPGDITAPILTPFGELDFEFEVPVPPADISGNFNWNATNYTSDMWGALFGKVHADILNGGTGLSQQVHSAIISREQEARRLNQTRVYQKELDSVGSNGFRLASGHIAALQRDVSDEMLNKDQDAVNNLLIEDFKLATENTRFAVTTGAEMEKMLRDTWNSIEDRGLEAEKAATDYMQAVYALNIQKFTAVYEGIKLELEAKQAKITAIASMNESVIKVAEGEANVYESQVKAISDQNQSTVDVRQTEVAVYSTEVEAATKEYSGVIDGIRAQLEVAQLQMTAEIEQGKFDLSKFTSRTQLASDAAQTIGKLAAQVVASALGAINTSLSSGYTGSEGITEKWGHTEGITERHNYEEA